jgi:hypothetical protein
VFKNQIRRSRIAFGDVDGGAGRNRH